MGIPKIKPETMSSIVEEVYIKKESFGLKDFASNLTEDNKEIAIILYSFIEAIADYMADDESEKSKEISAVAKMSCNLLYKTIDKQIEINEMNYE
jgi:hypothetical protein